jgi:hypothetical protein
MAYNTRLLTSGDKALKLNPSAVSIPKRRLGVPFGESKKPLEKSGK